MIEHSLTSNDCPRRVDDNFSRSNPMNEAIDGVLLRIGRNSTIKIAYSRVLFAI